MKHPTDEEIEKEAEWINILERNAFRTGAKWARDQQPKLKTLPWRSEFTVKHRSVNDMGAWVVYQNLDNEQWFWYKDGFNYKVMPCDNLDHGKQLAQSDYERRINELYI